MRLCLIGCLFFVVVACKLEIPETDRTQFSTEPTVASVPIGQIDTVSGLADSRSQPGNLWAIQAKDTAASLTMLGHDGQIKGQLKVPKFSNRDWEDLAIGPGPNPGTTYLYIGDIGDQDRQYGISQVYRLPEPSTLKTEITQIERINFRYPDGPQDARAMFVDPLTNDIYIIANRQPNVHLYRLAYPQNINEITLAEAYGELPISPVVSGASISPDGREIVVRTYGQVFYWKRAVGQAVADVMQKSNSRGAPLLPEPKGEAICFDKDGEGYFTLSQRASVTPVNLYYYKKIAQ
ncbi:PE-PGRS family protein [Spirosoma oryzicola]|uniref:PE-PGRS family protein n=1 Tax=Spirosoma oryzicola TaxID=2898794 RepID=UPI001E36AD3D|nr:PE-PGRS family protein [Spirosoma oryzicola]UHG89773.1 PE-PGRS family protein [Spirosoma oryzicola]